MKKFVSILLAVLVMVSVLSACGNNSGAGSSDTVKLAIACPVTGDSAEYGVHFSIAAEMAAEAINESGGINGRTVEIEIFDSKNDAKEAAEVARLIGQDGSILATIGDFSSTCAMAAAPIYEENQLVQVTPSAGLIDVPKTGDESKTGLWGALALISLAGAGVTAYLAFGKKHRKENK